MPEAEYTVAKAGTKWAVLRNGEPVRYYSYLDRKRDAVEAIPKIQAQAEYEARIKREDREGIIWTPAEQQNIANAIGWLRENKTQMTMWGESTYQQLVIKHFHDDGRTIEQWRDGIGGDASNNLICVEIRRRRAATIEAFKAIGIHLDHSRWNLKIARYVPGKMGWTQTYTYPTYEAVKEAYREMLETIDRACETGYFLTIARGKDV